MAVAAAARGTDADGGGHPPAAPHRRGRAGLPVGPARERGLARAVGRHLTGPGDPGAHVRRPRAAVRRRRPGGAGPAPRRRGRRAARRAAVRRVDRPGVVPVVLRGLLGEPGRRRPDGHPDRARARRRPRARHGRPAPDRGQHPAREHREPGGRAQARVPVRGAPAALPAHRGGVARPPVVRPDDRGPRRRDAHGAARAAHGSRHQTLETQSSQQSLARHTERGPASNGDAHLPS